MQVFQRMLKNRKYFRKSQNNKNNKFKYKMKALLVVVFA